MSLTVGPATDYLVAAATSAVSGITAGGKAFTVVDGEPGQLTGPMFLIGQATVAPDVSGDVRVSRQWADMGDFWVDEDYTIPCAIDARVGGTVLKTARDAVEAVFNAFWAYLLVDLTLGGILAPGHRAEVTELTFTPSNVGTVAEPGRRYLASFGVHVATPTK